MVLSDRLLFFINLLKMLLLSQHKIKHFSALDVQPALILARWTLNKFVKQSQSVLVSLLFRKNLHELNGRLHKFVTLSLDSLQNSVAIDRVCQDVEELCVKHLGPNVVKTDCLIVIGGGEVELETFTLKERVWDFISIKVLQIEEKSEAFVNLTSLSHVVQLFKKFMSVLREVYRTHEHPAAHISCIDYTVHMCVRL